MPCFLPVPARSLTAPPKGGLLLTSVRLPQSLGTAVTVDGETGDAYVAGFIADSASEGDSGDQIVVHKVWLITGVNKKGS